MNPGDAEDDIAADFDRLFRVGLATTGQFAEGVYHANGTGPTAASMMLDGARVI